MRNHDFSSAQRDGRAAGAAQEHNHAKLFQGGKRIKHASSVAANARCSACLPFQGPAAAALLLLLLLPPLLVAVGH
jgi:hypothetical protein